MTPNPLPRSWFVLHTKSRFENVVFDGLINKNIEAFLPKMTVPSKRKDRRLMIRVPLFPGYVFVRTDLSAPEHLEIVKTIGAVRLVGTNQGPVPVPDDSISSVKIMVDSSQPIKTGSQLQKGDKVIVTAGPFAGLTGIFIQYRGKDRVAVNIDALGQFAAIEVPQGYIEKIPPSLA
jgi:transcription elongation factor/antiterminator RfaH